MKSFWKDTEHAGKTALANFSAQFFLLCMGTGILAVNLQVLPYQFSGLGIISVIVWVLDLVLFFTACTLFATRWVLFPQSSMKEFESEPEQTMYLSTVAISSSTLIEMTALVLGNHWSGWDTVCLVLFWCDVALSTVAALLPIWLLFRKEHIKLRNLPPTALYPATAILSTASTGSVVITYTSLSVRAAQPILIMSYILLGLGFFISLAILANYTGRLMISGTPEPTKAMASFIPIAAISNAGYSATSLGRIAGPSKYLIAQYGQGTAANAQVGLAMYGTGVVLSLFFIGFASYWMLLSCLVVATDIKEAPFTLNYWSSLYPFGVYALALGQLAIDFDSPTFRTLNTLFVILLLLQWLFCMGMTIPRLITGEISLKSAPESKPSRESWSGAKRINSEEEGNTVEQQEQHRQERQQQEREQEHEHGQGQQQHEQEQEEQQQAREGGEEDEP